MTNSIQELEHAKLLFVIGSNTTEAHPVISYYMKRAIRNGAKMIVNDPRRIDLCRWASHYVQINPGSDVAYINGLMREIIANGWHDRAYIEKSTEGFEELRKTIESYTPERTSEITGVPVETIREIARILHETHPASVIYTLGITEHICGVDNVRSLANLQMLLGNIGFYAGGLNPLRGQNNVQGSCDMGALPNIFCGYQRVDDPTARNKFEKAWNVTGLNPKIGIMMPDMFTDALHGKLKAFMIAGENVVQTEPHMAHTIRCLEACEFIVLSEIFYNETAPYADVIFPDRAWGEEDGTFSNTERRFQRVRAAVKSPGEARSHWWIMNELAKRMGVDLKLDSSKDVWEEVRSLSPGFNGITWERIEQVGLQWPCPTTSHPGTPFLHVGGNFTRGKGLFAGIEYRPPAETPDAEYPFWLSTGRRLWHYHSGTQTHNSLGMDDLFGEELIEISPADAVNLGVKTGDWVRATSRRGAITLRAWVIDRSPTGVCWTSFHFSKACANELTIDAFDPISKTAEYKVCAIRIEKTADGQPLGSTQVPRRQARP
jgi:formate dehydrogenase major subunit